MYCLLVLVLVFSASAVFSEDCTGELCKPDETCCDTAIPGDYSCCPLPNAVCCVDHTHCCPEGTQCNIITGSCDPKTRQRSKLRTLNKLEKRIGVADEEESSDDYKPDACRYSDTCCPTGVAGGCNCCPYRNGVCCEGNAFCCPENYECDIVKGACSLKETIPGLEKRQGIFDEEGNVKKQCNDGSICPYDSTCCTVAGGKYGCCPHLYASCCPDKIHCCPHDELCDVTSRYCVKKQAVDQSTVERPALPIDFEDSA